MKESTSQSDLESDYAQSNEDDHYGLDIDELIAQDEYRQHRVRNARNM